jgi:hypothetical protein
MMMTVILFFFLVFCSLQLTKSTSAVNIRRLQSDEVTSHNIRLDFGGDGCNSPFTKDVQLDIENLASDILIKHLGSDVTLIDTTYVASTEKPTIYVKVQVRHPSFLSPSVKSHILLALRTNARSLIDYFTSSQEYGDISSVDVTSFESFEKLTDVGGTPTLRPSSVQSTSQPSGAKELVIPIQVTLDDQATVSGYAHYAITSISTKILRTELDKDIEFVSLTSSMKNGEEQAVYWLPLTLVVTVRHPEWMTSSYAKSRILDTLNNNVSKLYEDESLSDGWSILFEESAETVPVEDLTLSLDVNPTLSPTPNGPRPSMYDTPSDESAHSPTQTSEAAESTKAPATATTTEDAKTSTPSSLAQQPPRATRLESFQVFLNFRGVSNDAQFDDEMKDYIQQSVSGILSQHLKSDIELVDVHAKQFSASSTRHRYLRGSLGMGIVIDLIYSIDQEHDDVLEHVVSVLNANIGDIDMDVLRNAGEFFKDLEGIVVSTSSSSINPEPADITSATTESESKEGTFFDKMPLWVWIAIGSGILILLTTPLVLRRFFKAHFKARKATSVQQIKSENSFTKRHAHRRSRSSTMHLPKNSSSRHRSKSRRRSKHRRDLDKKHRSQSRPMNPGTPFPPPMRPYPALPCPTEPERLLAIQAPPILRRASSISDLPWSINPDESRMITPNNHHSNAIVPVDGLCGTSIVLLP